MKKRYCSACSIISPIHQNLALQGYLLCVCCLCVTAVAELCLHLVQLSAVDLYDFCGQDLVSVLLVGQSEATLGLSSLRPNICQSCSHTEL